MKKLIFDLDDTLLFLSKDWDVYYQKFIDEYKLKITPRELYAYIGEIEKVATNKLVTKDYFINFLKDRFSIIYTDEMFNSFLKYYLDIPLLHTDVIYDVLNYLKQHYKLIVYTNWFTDNQIDRLKKYNLDHFFAEIYGGDMLPTKPSKEGIMSITKDDDLKDYTFIGDNIECDIILPNEMGMNTIFYNKNKIKQDKYREIFNIIELKNIL